VTPLAKQLPRCSPTKRIPEATLCASRATKRGARRSGLLQTLAVAISKAVA
jgi:hypothetical protein